MCEPLEAASRVANAARWFGTSCRWRISATNSFDPVAGLLALGFECSRGSRFVPAYRRYPVPACPEMLSQKLPFPLAAHPRQMDRTLPLDKPIHL